MPCNGTNKKRILKKIKIMKEGMRIMGIFNKNQEMTKISFLSGNLEYSKIQNEIARKNNELFEIYEQLELICKSFENNQDGYVLIDNMKNDLEGVEKEILELHSDMVKSIEKLKS